MKIILLGSLCLMLAVLSTAYATDQDLLTVNDNYTSELNESALVWPWRDSLPGN